MRKAVVIFLAVAFGWSWGIAELFYRADDAPPWAALAMPVAFMWGPALGALAAVKWGLREPLASLGPVWRWNRWLIFAWFAPLVFALLFTLAAPLMPGVAFNFDPGVLARRLLAAVPPASREVVAGKLGVLGDWLPLALAAQIAFGALLAGATVNALVAFGEELGWRGFMQRLLPTLGFWRGTALVGLAWGLWHAPLILRGHNYPQHPQLGVLLMIAFCLLMAPLFAHLRERAGSVLAPSVMHGTLNATGGATMFVAGGSDLLIGPTGAAGLAVLAALNLLLWRQRRGTAA